MESWFHRLLNQLLGSKEPYEFFDFWSSLFFEGTPSDDAVPYFIYQSLPEEKKKWEQKYLELLGRSRKKSAAEEGPSISSEKVFVVEGELVGEEGQK